MDKIKINHVSKLLFKKKGFAKNGCINADCKDGCCKNPADIDKETYELILKNKKAIEKILNRKIEDCFKKRWYNGNFLGKKYIKSNTRKDGYCMFHLNEKKGCSLFKLVYEKGYDKRLIPTICRLFPITWTEDSLIYYDEIYKGYIPKGCNCLDPNNKTKNSIYETQKDHIKDIFDIKKRK
ncbi:MAG: hypothetical protein WC867_05750 [Candidatus Pacearchaeota archaeon]|jgi:hypothetical protein